jgi:hypothetical protein
MSLSGLIVFELFKNKNKINLIHFYNVCFLEFKFSVFVCINIYKELVACHFNNLLLLPEYAICGTAMRSRLHVVSQISGK